MSARDRKLKELSPPLKQQILHTESRLIIIGDIHGCYDELVQLLDKTNYDKENDILISVGDLVAKGPNTSDVIDFFMTHNSYVVMGNHEWAVLRWLEQTNTYGLKQKSQHQSLSKTLRKDQLEYLKNLPHIIHIPFYNLIIAHAGVDPSKEIKDNNSYDTMHIRNILKDGTTTELTTSGYKWITNWNGPEYIIFGHDAKVQIQESEYALGIDTACVYGERLSCVIYPNKEIISVESNMRYV